MSDIEDVKTEAVEETVTEETTTTEEVAVEATPETTTKEATPETTTKEAAPEATTEAPAATVGEDGEEIEERILALGDTSDFKWFIAKTMTGQENKVSRALRERIINLKQTESFAEILVPEETVVTNVNGKKRRIKKKFFPGYVLLKMIMNDNTWHLVKDTDKITGFVGGTSTNPAPVSDEEAAYMTNQAEEGFKKPRTSVNFSEGDQVKVIEGPFASFVGTIENVNEKGKVRVNVSIFGRPTPVELDFTQVEKVS